MTNIPRLRTLPSHLNKTEISTSSLYIDSSLVEKRFSPNETSNTLEHQEDIEYHSELN